MQQTFFRLWTLVTLCAMVLGLLPVSTAVAAPVQTSVSYATALVSLYRVDIKLNNTYARNQLTTQQIPVLRETATTATVLVDMNQIGWLARTGYAPQRFMSITRVAGLTTPTLSMTLPRGQRLVEVMAQTASPLRSWAQSLDAKRAGLITTSSAVDTDGDGLSDDDEAIWCLDATKKQTIVYGANITDQVLVQRAYDWMANRRAESVGYIPYPASRVNDSSGTCVDTDVDGVPNTVEIALGLNPARSSTDLDKYNDAMELFGQTVGSSTPMPAYVRNPGRHPLVAAFPKPVITIVDNSINVTLKTTVLTNGNAVSTTSRTYASRQENTVETERTDDTVWADWLRVDTSAAVGGASQRVRTMDAGGADEWTVYHKDTETSDGGTGAENWADWTGIVNCITAGFYDATSECSESFVTYEEEPAPNSGDPCVFDASGCGNDTQWDSYVTNPDEVTVGGEIAPDDMGIGDVGLCTTGLLGACVPDMFITTEDDIWDTGAADDQRPSEQSGDVIEQSTNDGSATVIDVQPIEEAPPIAPELTPESDGATDNTEQTVSVVTYEEQDITSPGQIVTVQTIDSMTAVDTTHAADLKFTYAVRNEGTDMITELKNIKFNIYLNNDELPIVTYAPSFTFENKQPGEELRVTMGANEPIPLTLEQLKAIEVDPDCAAAVAQGTLPASTQCPGGRVRITVADMSYGVDQTFYDNAVAGGMMIGVDDGTSDGASTIDWFVVPTWDGGTPDTIADVMGRYFTMLRDGDGVMTGIRTPKFSAAASVPRGCTPALVGTGGNQIKWCEFGLHKTQWMEILTDGVSVSQDIATAPASAGGNVVLRLQRDSDSDGYSDSAEQEYGTNPTNGGQRPTPELLAVVVGRAVSGVTEGMLAFANLGDYPASGVKATMFSPSEGTSLRNRQVGGSGEVPAQSTLIIGSGSAVNQNASNWTGSSQIVLDGYYTGAIDRQYTLTVVCVVDPCGVGEGDVSVAWVDTQGGSGTLALGATYAAPTQLVLGEDELTFGFETGTLLNGETIVIAATAPSDTFRWVVNDSAAPQPLVVVEYGDGSGSRRFVLPAGAYIDATSEFSIDNLTTTINTLKGTMLRAPTLDMVSRNYTPDVGGEITLLLDNPLPTTLQATQVLLRIMDADGTKVFETAQSLDDVGSGPSIVDALSWQTSDFIGGYDATLAYTVLALWGDHQGNEIDRQVRMLSDFQNDRMPELAVSIEGSTPIVIPRGTATREINFGTLKLGDSMKRLLNITNVGDVPLRGYIDAVANAQTSFAGSFFVPPGLTLPYMVSVDSGQLDTGSYSQTVELRTSDMQWPVLRLVLKAEVTSTGAVNTQSYIIDPYRPLTTGLYVKGPRNTRDSMTYTEATGVDAVKVQPLVVRNDLTDDVLGLGRRIATNPSAYGYDPALVGLGMQGALDVAPQGVVTPKDVATTPDVNNGCYWREANGTRHRYEYNQTQSDWFGAKNAANARTFNGVTGYLATVMTAAEQQCIYQLIGREPSASANGTWLGGKYVAGIWTWNDGPENGQPIVTQYWRGGEPNNMGSPTDCAASHSPTYVSPWNASWNDVPCDWPTPLGAIIEYSSTGTALDGGNSGATATRTPLPSTTPSTSRTVSPTNTPSGSATTPDINNSCYWREADGTRHRYEYNQTQSDWGTAKLAAMARQYNGVSGYLATINNSAEAQCISQFLGQQSSYDWNWLGGKYSSGTWYWNNGPDDGAVISPTYWRGGEPNNMHEPTDCLAFGAPTVATWNASWADVPCNWPTPLGSIIEYSSTGTALDGGNSGVTPSFSPTASRTPTPSSNANNLALFLDASNPASYPGTGNTWYDLSPNHADAMLRNGMHFDSANGGKFILDGVDDYAQVPAGFGDFTEGMTIIAGVNFERTSGDSFMERIIDFGNGSGPNNIIFGRRDRSTNLYLEATQPTRYDGCFSCISTSSFAVYAVRFGNGKVTFFKNGIQTSETPANPSAFVQVNHTLNYIGRSNWAADAYLQGSISALKIYKTALSDAQIVADSNDFVTKFVNTGATPTASRTSSSNTSTSVVQLLNVGRSAFLVKQDGTVISWGTGEAANVPSGLNNVKQISGDVGNWDLGTVGEYAIALKKDGTLAQWGRVPPGMPSGLNNVVHVEAGIDVAYAVRADGTVVGWGIDRSGNLATPSNVGLIKSICVGAWYTLALRRDGTLIGWGEYGRYGNLSSYRNIKSIDCEGDGWVGLTEDGRVVGQGLYGNNVPVPGGLSDVVEIASGRYVSFARKTNGSVIAWGRNFEGDASVPLGLLDAVTVSAGHSAEVGIALRNNGSLIAWGSNTGNVFNFPAGRFSFVGSNSASPTSTLTPTRTTTSSSGSGDTSIIIQNNGGLQSLMPPASELKDIVQVCAGDDDIVVLKRDGTIRKWGRVNEGIPTWVTQPGANIKQIACGGNGGLALNGSGQIINLGSIGTIPTLTNVKQIVAGGNNVFASDGHAAALLSNGTVNVWGTIANYGSIKPVPSGLSDIAKLAHQDASRHFLALKNNGTVIAWGANWSGQADVPVGLTNVVNIGVGIEHSIALKSDGTLIMWGNNSYGQLNPPAGLSNIVEITGGWYHTLARLSDGRVVSWGELSTVPAELTGKKVIGMAGSEHWSVFVVQDGSGATATRTLPPTHTFTPSRTLTPSRTATQTPTLTPTPNDAFAVDKADTGPERERRIYIPSGFSKSARYSVENGLMYTYTNSNSAQTASVRMPRVDYDAFTLEVWTLNSTTGKVDIDLGANGSVDWSTTFTQVGRSSSINMATALNTYLAGRTGTTVDIPIKITSARTGSLLVANVVGVPKPQVDLNATGIIYDGTTTQSNGWPMAVVPRGVVSVVRATIKNDGRMPSDVSTAALAAVIPGDGLFYIDSQPIPRINPGSSTTVSFRWDTTQWLNMTGQVQVVIDPYNTLAERAEGNNLRMMNFRIQSGQIVASPTVTQTATNTRTATRTPTHTRTPTNTRTPTHTRTSTATMTNTVPPTMVAASALQVRYRFEEASSATSYADASGKANPLQCVANDATCPHTGSGAVNDDMGNAVYFDSASTTRLRTQNTISLGAGSFSVSAWIRLDDTDRQQTIVSYGATANKLFAMGVTSDNKVFCQAGTKMAVSGASINTAGRMLTCIYDATTSKLTLFVDRDVVMTTPNVLYSNVGDKLSLGARWLGTNAPTEVFGGWLDEVNFWQGALTARQIDALYNQPRSVVNRTPTRVGP